MSERFADCTLSRLQGISDLAGREKKRNRLAEIEIQLVHMKDSVVSITYRKQLEAERDKLTTQLRDGE